MHPDSRGPSRAGSAVVGLALIVISVTVLAWNWKWAQSVFQGPTDISPDQLLAVSNPESLPNQWVTIPCDRAVETGLEVVVTNRKNAVRSRYVLIAVKDRWLVTEVKNGPVPRKVSGYLSVWKSPFAQNALTKITAQHGNARLLPFQLDAEYNQTAQCYSMLGVMGFFLLCGVCALGMSFTAGKQDQPAASENPFLARGPGAPEGFRWR